MEPKETDQYYNSHEMAKKVGRILKLDREEEKALYDQLCLFSDGPVKKAIDGLIKWVKLSLNSDMGKKDIPMNVYAACIRADSVRDAQYETKAGSDHRDDDAWLNAEMPLFIDMIPAESPDNAKLIAAAQAGVEPDVIALFTIREE